MSEALVAVLEALEVVADGEWIDFDFDLLRGALVHERDQHEALALEALVEGVDWTLPKMAALVRFERALVGVVDDLERGEVATARATAYRAEAAFRASVGSSPTPPLAAALLHVRRGVQHRATEN